MLRLWEVERGPYRVSFIEVNCRGMFVQIDEIKCELQGYPRDFVNVLTNATQGSIAEYPYSFEGNLKGVIMPWLGPEQEHIGFKLFLPGAARSERTGQRLRTSEVIKLVRVINDYWLI
jgi:hypothetical protein